MSISVNVREVHVPVSVALTVTAFTLTLHTDFHLRGINYTVIIAVSPRRENKIPESMSPYRLNLFQNPVSFMDITFIALRKPVLYFYSIFLKFGIMHGKDVII